MARKAKSAAQREADAQIGRRIERARGAKGMTQGALGSALGVAQQTIYAYECGAHRLPANLVADLCRALEISPRWLLGVTTNCGNFLRARREMLR